MKKEKLILSLIKDDIKFKTGNGLRELGLEQIIIFFILVIQLLS